MTNSTDVQKWADNSMYTAEPMSQEQDVKAFLLSGPADPLGGIAACVKMYKGEVVRDLADVTDAERTSALEQIQKTILAMPLEAVSLHFMLEGVHRGVTHQMVRQRTAAYAQESTRFAVKEDAVSAIALPPSLEDTSSLAELVELDRLHRIELGLSPFSSETDQSNDNGPSDEWRSSRYIAAVREEALNKGGLQAQRIKWDEAVQKVGETYLNLVSDGMPAEEARGLLATNLRTRLHYITNLRNFYAEMGKRLSDQAQFEWRKVAMAYAVAMREFGQTQSYWTTITRKEYNSWDQSYPSNPILERKFDSDGARPGSNHPMWEDPVKVRLSSEWQYIALTHEMKPVDFQIGRRAFAADFDRPSRIAERVDAFASKGVPSSEWTKGSTEHGIPPIHPDEWLMDPNSARLSAGMEFDVFGNRVPVGTGWHWQDGMLVQWYAGADGAMDLHRERHWPRDFSNGGE